MGARSLRAVVRLLFALAILCFLPVAGTAADSLDHILQQAQKLIQDHDLPGARAELTRGIKEFPNDGNLYGLLGVVEAQEGNYAAAEASFKKALAAIPRFTGAYLNLGRLYQENAAKDPEALQKALGTYEKLLGFQPDNREALFQSALLHLRQGFFQASLDRLGRLAAAEQEYPQALAVKCAALAATGKREEAASVADRLLQNPQTTEADIFQMLPTLEAHGAGDLAAKTLQTFAEQRRGSYELFYALGLLYKRQGNTAGARETLEKAAQFRPHDAPLLIDLARVAYTQKDRKGVLGYLAHARDLQPQNGGIHFFWGVVCVEEGLAQEAYTAFKRAVELDPENPYYNYALGSVAVQRSDPSEAIPYFQKYRQLKPDDPSGRLALGAAYLESYDYDKAKVELNEATKFPKTAGGAHYYLARAANQSGDYAGALAELQAALKTHPAAPEVHAEMGATYLKLKDYPQAGKALEKALELRPDSYTANLNLMILYQRTKDPRAKEQAERFQQIRDKWDKSKMDMLRSVQVVP